MFEMDYVYANSGTLHLSTRYEEKIASEKKESSTLEKIFLSITVFRINVPYAMQ